MGPLSLEELNAFTGIGLWVILIMSAIFGLTLALMRHRPRKLRKPEEFEQWLDGKRREKVKPYDKDRDGDGPIIDV